MRSLRDPFRCSWKDNYDFLWEQCSGSGQRKVLGRTGLANLRLGVDMHQFWWQPPALTVAGSANLQHSSCIDKGLRRQELSPQKREMWHWLVHCLSQIFTINGFRGPEMDTTSQFTVAFYIGCFWWYCINPIMVLVLNQFLTHIKSAICSLLFLNQSPLKISQSLNNVSANIDQSCSTSCTIEPQI